MKKFIESPHFYGEHLCENKSIELHNLILDKTERTNANNIYPRSSE